MSPGFLQSENVPVKGNGLVQIGDPITGVEELLQHGLLNCACFQVISNANGVPPLNVIG
jgi:hypothetical protein